MNFKHGIKMLLILLAQILFSETSKVHFMPFGAGDQKLVAGDDKLLDIAVPQGIRMGSSANLTKLRVTVDGTVGEVKTGATSTFLSRVPIEDFTTVENIVFVYWSDLDTTKQGSVYVRVSDLSTNVSDQKKINSVIKLKDPGFNAKTAVIATWDGVPKWAAVPGHATLLNSFQLVIATDGLKTYAIYNFDNLTLYQASANLQASSGYITKESGIVPKNVCNLPGSFSEDSMLLNCKSNVGTPGQWLVGLTPNALYQCPGNNITDECGGIVKSSAILPTTRPPTTNPLATTEPPMKPVSTGVPFVTPSTTDDPKCAGKKNRYYLFANDKNCQRYFQCSNGIYIEMKCAGGKQFNEATQECESASPYGCLDPFCQGKADGLYKDDTRCKSYTRCIGGLKTLLSCPAGSYFDQLQGICTICVPSGCQDPDCYNKVAGLYSSSNTSCAGKHVYTCDGKGFKSAAPVNCPYYDRLLKKCVATTPASCKQCNTEPCKHGGTCTNVGANDYSCKCTKYGYKGKNCEEVKHCNDPTALCQNGFTCKETQHYFGMFCQCNITYSPDAPVYLGTAEPPKKDKDLTTKCESRNGVYGAWSSWKACTKQCGGGVHERARTCVGRLELGNDCGGCLTDYKPCNTVPCPINCGWSQWQNWGVCSAPCGPGTKLRARTAEKPPAQYGGKECVGANFEVAACNMKSCAIHGGWSQWSALSACSKACGPGEKIRRRVCNSPVPQHGGNACTGAGTEKVACNEKPCSINGSWSQWSAYSACSHTCNEGSQIRTRACNNPAPQHGGAACVGSDHDSKHCLIKLCAIECNPIGDIGLIVDESNSIDQNEFRLQKAFLKFLGHEFKMAPKIGVHFSLIGFATDAKLKFDFTKYYNNASYSNYVDTEYKQGGCSKSSLFCLTDIVEALTLAKNKMFTLGNGWRSDLPTALLLMTDGQHNVLSSGVPTDSYPIAQYMRDVLNITIFTIGIGPVVNPITLSNISGSYDNFYAVKSFAELATSNIHEKIAFKIRDKKCPYYNNYTCGPCSTDCGNGTRVCTRTCKFPDPAYKGRVNCTDMFGPPTKVEKCHIPIPTCQVNGNWSKWSACSVPCGGGIRTRTCTNPIPKNFGNPCVGPSSELCNIQPCLKQDGHMCIGQNVYDAGDGCSSFSKKYTIKVMSALKKSNSEIPVAVFVEVWFKDLIATPMVTSYDADNITFLVASNDAAHLLTRTATHLVINQHVNSSTDRFNHGVIMFPIHTMQTKCVPVTFNKKMLAVPAVKLTLHGPCLSSYVNLWAKNITTHGFQICGREGIAFSGKHEKVTVHYMAVAGDDNKHPGVIPHQIDTRTESMKVNLGNSCEVIHFRTYFKENPHVFVTAEQVSTDPRGVYIAYVKSVEPGKAEICGKHSYDQLSGKRHMPVRVNVIIIGHRSEFDSGVVQLEPVQPVVKAPTIFCKNVKLNLAMFDTSFPIGVQLTPSWEAQTSGWNGVHEAVATWSEDVSHSGFRVCAMVAGHHFELKSYPVPELHWLAYQVIGTDCHQSLNMQAGFVILPTWYTGSKCTELTLRHEFTAASKVFVSVEHSDKNNYADAITAWSEVRTIANTTSMIVRLCARELQNFEGKHEGIKLNWLVVYKELMPFGRKAGEVHFPKMVLSPNGPLPAVCKIVSFDAIEVGSFLRDYRYSLILTPKNQSVGCVDCSKYFSPNDFVSWIEQRNLTHAKVCLKSLRCGIHREAASISIMAVPSECDPGWSQFGDRCYWKNIILKTFADANSFCAARNSHLPHGDKTQSNYLQMYAGQKQAWLGVTDARKEGDWVFNGGNVTAPYADWSLGAPNGGLTESCAVVRGGRLSGWDDVICSSHNFVICQTTSGLRCKGTDNCCTNAKRCSPGEGSCSTDSNCIPGLKCLKYSCPWGGSDSCCIA